MSEVKKYCEGIDCAWCGEKEPCIYKIANELEEELKAKKQECQELKKDKERLLQTIIKDQAEIVQKNIDETNILLIKENMDLQQQLGQLEAEKTELKKVIKHYKQIAQYHGGLSVKYANKNAKLNQTIVNIKESVNKIHNVEECEE